MTLSRMHATPERPRPGKAMPSWLGWVRLLVGLLLLAWIGMSMPLVQLRGVMAESLHRWPWWVLATALTFSGLVAGSMRWHRILVQQGFASTRREVFRFFFIGQFFNSFLPGGCGGDLVRAFYAAKLAPSAKARAASTVLLDRAIGLLATIAAGCFFILLRAPFFFSNNMLRLASLFMFGLLAGTITTLMLALRVDMFEHSPRLAKLGRSRWGEILRAIYDNFYFCRRQPRLLLSATLLSLVNLAMLTLACYCFGRSLNIPLGLLDYFALYPVITVLTSIPLTPGALGVREGLFEGLFRAFGIAGFRAVPLSLMVYADGLFWSLFGGLLFLLHPREERRQLTKAARAIREPTKSKQRH